MPVGRQLSDLFFQANNYDSAIKSLIECADLAPDDALKLWNVGVLVRCAHVFSQASTGVMLQRINRYVEALSWMDQALKFQPDNTKLLQGAGATALAAGKHLDAPEGTVILAVRPAARCNSLPGDTAGAAAAHTPGLLAHDPLSGWLMR